MPITITNNSIPHQLIPVEISREFAVRRTNLVDLTLIRWLALLSSYGKELVRKVGLGCGEPGWRVFSCGGLLTPVILRRLVVKDSKLLTLEIGRMLVSNPGVVELSTAPNWFWPRETGGGYFSEEELRVWLSWGKLRKVNLDDQVDDVGKVKIPVADRQLRLLHREIFWRMLPYYCYWVRWVKWREDNDQLWDKITQYYGIGRAAYGRNGLAGWDGLYLGRLGQVGWMVGLDTKQRRELMKDSRLKGFTSDFLQGLYQLGAASRKDRIAVRLQIQQQAIQRAHELELREQRRLEKEQQELAKPTLISYKQSDGKLDRFAEGRLGDLAEITTWLDQIEVV